jgi:hypothetical protein
MAEPVIIASNFVAAFRIPEKEKYQRQPQLLNNAVTKRNTRVDVAHKVKKKCYLERTRTFPKKIKVLLM